ncbi:MAG: glycosyltransferase [Vicinamibacterales bacterium]
MLAGRSGSELYTAEVAEGLIARGHSVVLYTPVPGRLAAQLQARAIPVVSDLRTMTEPPDVIHGQHTHETLTALLAFPGVPAIQMHHGWVDLPPTPFPRILRHVAVDDTVRDRLVSEWGIPLHRVDVVRNFVDLSTLPARAPLPVKPTRAVVFSNSAAHHLAAVRDACTVRGIQVDAIGADVGEVAERPGEILGSYDLVFAKARCAMEAMAVGTAVVLCDRSGLGSMVDTRNFDDLRRLNFGLRTLREPLTATAIAAQLDRYDPLDAANVSARIRAEAHIGGALDRLLQLYDEVLDEWQATPHHAVDDELRSASVYLQRITAEPRPRVAAGALFKAAYFRMRQWPIVRRLLPSPSAALRIYRSIRNR